MATKMCCKRPMIVIKATTGVLRQGNMENKMPEKPIRLYKCEKCGRLVEEDG